MNFNNILTKFGQDIGVGPVALDERDSCYLRFDQHTLALEHIPSQNQLFVYTSFTDLLHGDQKTIFEQLLTCNHFGQGSGNGWFSFNPETQETFLMTKVKTDTLDYDEFVLHLEAFLHSLDRANTFINSLKQVSSGPLHHKMHLKNPFA